MAQVSRIARLSASEELLRKLLLGCRDELVDQGFAALTIWFVGGWVRDKLLGVKNTDIDAAICSMTGLQFGNTLANFYLRKGEEYKKEAIKFGLPSEFKGPHKIGRNAHKSKHLETATATVFGLEIDLVNLRSEIYSEDSRTPQTEFGTAKGDAFRRDATINALFYNLDSQRVEDFTGQGLQDMAMRMIRTPLNPHRTFLDDPLRILRLVRFASSLNYTIDPEVMTAMQDEKIHAALTAKISRERVAIELGKMLNGRCPHRALQLIHHAGLYSTVFLGPFDHLRQYLVPMLPEQVSAQPWPATWFRAYQTLSSLMDDQSSDLNTVAHSGSSWDIWILAAYAPIAGLRHKDIAGTVDSVTQAIKATSKTSSLLEKALRHMDHIESMVELVARGSVIPRSTIGMAIRSWGASWKLQLLFSLLAEITYHTSNDSSSELSSLGRYSTFMRFVAQHRLQDAHLIKPVLDGRDILKIFGLNKGGPFVRIALNGLLTWQFDHDKSSRNEALKWLSTKKEAFGVPQGERVSHETLAR